MNAFASALAGSEAVGHSRVGQGTSEGCGGNGTLSACTPAEGNNAAVSSSPRRRTLPPNCRSVDKVTPKSVFELCARGHHTRERRHCDAVCRWLYSQQARRLGI